MNVWKENARLLGLNAVLDVAAIEYKRLINVIEEFCPPPLSFCFGPNDHSNALRAAFDSKDSAIAELSRTKQNTIDSHKSKISGLEAELKALQAENEAFKAKELSEFPLNTYKITFNDGTYEQVSAHYQFADSFKIHGQEEPVFEVFTAVQSIRKMESK